MLPPIVTWLVRGVKGKCGGVDVCEGRFYGGWLVKMRLAAAMNIPPTPWQKDTWTSGTWWATSPRTWRTDSSMANIPYIPVGV